MKQYQHIENPMVMPRPFIPYEPPIHYLNTGCDVCSKWEATVQFRQIKLCNECASEEQIRVL